MDGDLFYPDSIRIGSTLKPSATAQIVIDNSITALAVCSTCPIQQTCLQAAVDNAEEYGIWGGTFPYERHTVAPFNEMTDHGFIWQAKIRTFAEKKGLSCPPLPKPTPGYERHDGSIFTLQRSQPWG
jgi:hypothetical protein